MNLTLISYYITRIVRPIISTKWSYSTLNSQAPFSSFSSSISLLQFHLWTMLNKHISKTITKVRRMGRSPCCSNSRGLKKGPWTPDEDEKLVSHIQNHSHGSWRALAKAAGLSRCGKSCRLRWHNYLRPDIKRGQFSEEEDNLIIQLHSVLGNKYVYLLCHVFQYFFCIV